MTGQKKIAALLIPLLALSACMVGPDYNGPPKTAPRAESGAPFVRDNAEVTPVTPPAAWWNNFGDPELVKLVNEALAASPTIAEAQARVRGGRAALGGSIAQLFPNGNAESTYARLRLPGGAAQGAVSSAAGAASTALGVPVAAPSLPDGTQTNYYNAGFDATWEIDIFGGLRRGVQASGAEEEAAEYQLADAQVQLAAEVGQAYINLRDTQRRLEIQQQTAVLETQEAQLTDMRRKRGTAADTDYIRMLQQLAQTQAQIAPLEGQVQQAMDQLSLLTAQEPGTLDAELSPPKSVPAPPTQTPVGDPAQLLQRRPDVRAAERMLAASNAEIGVARAQEFPRLTLLGDLSWGGTQLGDIGKNNSLLWAAAPMLQWNFLDFGRNAARVEQARAANDAARAQYRQTVLSALQDAESALSRYGHQRTSLAALIESRNLAERAAQIVRTQYAAGVVTQIDVLDTERQRLQAEQSLEQGMAQFSDDYISLQKSLGLGWQAF